MSESPELEKIYASLPKELFKLRLPLDVFLDITLIQVLPRLTVYEDGTWYFSFLGLNIHRDKEVKKA